MDEYAVNEGFNLSLSHCIPKTGGQPHELHHIQSVVSELGITQTRSGAVPLETEREAEGEAGKRGIIK